MVPMGEWNTGKGGTSAGGCDSRDHLKRNLMIGQRFDFLATAAKDEWVATFEPYYVCRPLCQPDKQMVDGFLLQRVIGLGFTGVDKFSCRIAAAENRIADKPIVDNDIRLLDQS